MTVRSKASREKARSLIEMFRVSSPPVPVETIANELGFVIMPYDFPDDTSGVLLIRPDAKVIGFNQNHSPARQRFSIAHELGHYLNGHEDFSVDGKGEKIRIDGQFDWSDPQQRNEMEANEFAAELLMPSDLIKRDAASQGKLDARQLAERYEVSEQAMWIQLIDLKIAPN